MNSGQMLITMSAMVLLSIVILNVNRNSLMNTVAMDESKYQLLAVSLGTAIIEEAFSKPFDERTANNLTADTTLVLSVNLGPDLSENTIADFDDFDDFNNYKGSTVGDTTFQSARMYYRCKVHYVDPDVSLDSVASRTWHKKITVYISSPFIEDSTTNVVMTKINSHYFFR
ncbi:MAG: hypothetical protein OQJ81_03810 [Melioribacteraceae bacterium]|nr:hypothetical protein [Melioribacteraceae bacterium]